MDKVGQASNSVTSPFIPATQGRYLTVPSLLEIPRPPVNRRPTTTSICLKICTCCGIIFLLTVFIVFGYAVFISKPSYTTRRSAAEPI
ncbi:unnamed protein product [Caenorhabditis angaria]|uniref:Uncharacterized protein n=1 Tax=Caenorhabditis angaria TaxID=860376 RepID=A0A9P1J4M2_9PELO|nr:unnamed protein product [Caenorhabditis angaria]